MALKINKESLCWTCEKALPGSGCSWSSSFEPVDGWEATPKYLGNNGKDFAKTYCIINCPNFEMSEKLKWKDCCHCAKYYKCVVKKFGACSDFMERLDREQGVSIG